MRSDEFPVKLKYRLCCAAGVTHIYLVPPSRWEADNVSSPVLLVCGFSIRCIPLSTEAYW